MDETEKYISQFPAYELIERIVKFRVMENQNREIKRAESHAINSTGKVSIGSNPYVNTKAESLATNSIGKCLMEQNMYINPKAESLAINSIGQRPMKRHTPANPKPQRGVINPNINH